MSEAVDEYVPEGFVVPPEGVPVSVAAAIFGAVNEETRSQHRMPRLISRYGAR